MTPKYGREVDYTAEPTDAGPALPLDTYAGRYTNDFYGVVTVEIDEDSLAIRLGPDQTSYAMRHISHDTFLYQPTGENAGGESAVSFAVGANGLANAVTIEISISIIRERLLETTNWLDDVICYPSSVTSDDG